MTKKTPILELLLLLLLFNSCDLAGNIDNTKKTTINYPPREELINGLDSLFSIGNLLSHFPKAFIEGNPQSTEWWSIYALPPSYIIDVDTIYSELSANAYFVKKTTKEFIDSLISHSSFIDVVPFSSDSIIRIKISNIKSPEPYTRKYNKISPNVDTNRAPIPDFESAGFGLGTVTDDTLGYSPYNDTLLLMGDREILPDDLTIYVTESQNGDYWKIKNTEPRPCLPHKWKHGYSKGYAISQKQTMVCYWMMAW